MFTPLKTYASSQKQNSRGLGRVCRHGRDAGHWNQLVPGRDCTGLPVVNCHFLVEQHSQTTSDCDCHPQIVMVTAQTVTMTTTDPHLLQLCQTLLSGPPSHAQRGNCQRMHAVPLPPPPPTTCITWKKTNHHLNQTQVGIGDSAPTHRGGHAGT